MIGFGQRFGEELAAAAARQTRRRRWLPARPIRARGRAMLLLAALALVGAGGTAGYLAVRGHVGGPPTLRFARISPAQRAAGIRPLTRPVIFATGRLDGDGRDWQLIGFQTSRGLCIELDWPQQNLARGCGQNTPAQGRVIDWQGQVALAGGRRGIVVGAVRPTVARVDVRYLHSVYRRPLHAVARVIQVRDRQLLSAMGLHAPFAYYIAELRGPFFGMRADAYDANGNILSRAGIPNDMTDAAGGNFIVPGQGCGEQPRASVPPRFVSTPPPTRVRALLGVVRRPSRLADRLPDAFQRSLASWPDTVAVELDAIRRLQTAADGSVLYLVPTIGRARPGPAADCLRTLTPAEHALEARAIARARAAQTGFRLGLVALVAHGAGGTPNFHLPLTTSARGANVFGHLVFGLVPDGVAVVDLRFADGTRRTATVHANSWSVLVPTNAGQTRLTAQTWRDARGRPIPAAQPKSP